MPTPRLTLTNLTLSYRRHPAVHHISGSFEPGSLTAITGPNGAGKSTLLRALAGLSKPESGTITQEGEGRIAFMPQATSLQRDFPLSLLQLACMGLWHQSGATRAITAEGRSKAIAALQQTGLSGLENRDIASLSTGQLQRGLFARLMLQDAPVILLDEPFAALDESTTRHLLGILKNWHREGRTIIAVLHDVEQIRAHFPQCLLMAREAIAWDATPRALHPENLLKARFFRPGWDDAASACQEAI